MSFRSNTSITIKTLSRTRRAKGAGCVMSHAGREGGGEEFHGSRCAVGTSAVFGLVDGGVIDEIKVRTGDLLITLPMRGHVESLNVVLGTTGAGAYGPDGKLYRVPDTGAVRTFTSDRLTGLGSLPVQGGIPDPVLRKLLSGDVAVPA